VHQTPANFRGRGPIHTLLLSVFSASSNDFVAEGRTVGPGHLKAPFSVSRSELESFAGVDTKVSGWGPLFGGITVLTLIALGFLVRRRQPRGPFISLLIVLGAVTISVLLLPDHWNARYAPHLVLIPLAAAIYIILWETGGVRRFAWLIAATMVVNLVLIAGPCFWAAFTKTRTLNRQLSELVAHKQPVQVCFGELHFNRARFKSLGIKYQEVPFSQDVKGEPLAGFLPQAQTTIYSDQGQKGMGN